MSKVDVVVDCRWLGYSGVGRVTEFLLEGLRELDPPGAWSLWGPRTAEEFLWSGARIVETDLAPTQLAAQREVLSVPHGDVTLWMHAVRPLVSRRSIVLLHDLIPVHWDGNRATRSAWRSFFRRSCRTATIVAVYSDATRSQAASELGVGDTRKLSLPFDRSRAERVRSLRSARSHSTRQPMMLYVGQIKSHKNVRRAVEAFYASEFSKRGGKFIVLAGGATSAHELYAIDALRSSQGPYQVEIRSAVSDAELDELYAAASFLIQPSLEEGFGLPVTEALAGGVPVCCSDIASLNEAAQGRAILFDPRSILSMASAIDEIATLASGGEVPDPPKMPTASGFAAEFLELIEEVV